MYLRDQNQVAKASVGRRQKAVIKSKSRSPNVRSSASSSPNIAIPPILPESEDAHAICFFVSSFVLYPRDTRADRGYLEYLPFLFDNLRVDSALSVSLAASAHVMFGKWERKVKDAELLTFPLYTKALKATRKSLEDPEERVLDETLMAVCLLGFFEVGVTV